MYITWIKSEVYWVVSSYHMKAEIFCYVCKKKKKKKKKRKAREYRHFLLSCKSRLLNSGVPCSLVGRIIMGSSKFKLTGGILGFCNSKWPYWIQSRFMNKTNVKMGGIFMCKKQIVKGGYYIPNLKLADVLCASQNFNKFWKIMYASYCPTNSQVALKF